LDGTSGGTSPQIAPLAAMPAAAIERQVLNVGVVGNGKHIPRAVAPGYYDIVNLTLNKRIALLFARS
jgi:hypothetical protein